MMLDYARASGTMPLQTGEGFGGSFFLVDRAYPLASEPSGGDFLSLGLGEAAVTRRILPPNDSRNG